jgi:acetyl esterase/lipase
LNYSNTSTISNFYDKSINMGGILTIHPFKALYTFLAVLFEAARMPLWILYYIPSFTRPHPQWTLSQAIRMKVVKAFLKHSSAVRVKTPLSLTPGAEGDRFVVLSPPAPATFQGPTIDKNIKPMKVGSTWTPKSLQRSQADTADVVLHFHGGAYVIGDGRDADIGFTAKTILKYGKVTHVFTPQYRLASNEGGHFPAALQDAITAYSHLVHKLRIHPSKVTISGDSAGGNLALGLLRYINDFGSKAGLPWPGCVWLWSPWVDVVAGLDPNKILTSPQYHTDYLGAGFGYWGSELFSQTKNPSDPYLSPINNAFLSKSPIFVQTGRAEVLYDDDYEIAQQFMDKGTKVELVVKRNAPHDIILIGHLLDFQVEAQDSAKIAGDFLRANRFMG